MPEMGFVIRWPDGQRETCYSPSLVVRDYLSEGGTYPLDDFLARVRTALRIASDRVEAKYGFACSRALGQLARLEARAAVFSQTPSAEVVCENFLTEFRP